jgi:hypothetical protein
MIKKNIIRLLIVVMLLIVSNLVNAADFTEQKLGPGPDVIVRGQKSTKAIKKSNGFIEIMTGTTAAQRDQFLEALYQDRKSIINALGFSRAQLESTVYLTDCDVITNEIRSIPYTSFKGILTILEFVEGSTVKKIQRGNLIGFSHQVSGMPPGNFYFSNDGGTMFLKVMNFEGETQYMDTVKDKLGSSIVFKAIVDRAIVDMIDFIVRKSKEK